MQLKQFIGGVWRRVRFGNRRATTNCDPCCAPQGPWYIRAIACQYGPTSGPCSIAPRPDIWVCVDALLTNGRTIRQDYTAPATFTFNHGGWCYTTTYKPYEGLPDTATEAEAIASGLERILCGEALGTVVNNCNDDRCPTGIGFIEASLCRPGEGANPPRVFVCAGAVIEACTFHYLGFCYCVAPGPTVDLSAVPTTAIVFYTSPCEQVDGNHLQRTCCQCLPGCTWAPLRGDYSRICCCGEMTLVAYATAWRVRRTQYPSRTYQQWEGSATRGTPDAMGRLPFSAKFTSVTADGRVNTFTVDSFLRLPTLRCGFPADPFNDGSPPAQWCQFGVCTDNPQYNMPEAFGMQYLEPSFPNPASAVGTLNGVSNASCNSIAARLQGATTYTYDDGTTETLEADYTVNLTFNVVVPPECRGACLGSTDTQAKSTSKATGCADCAKNRAEALESML